jgi:hypothetical protein
MYNQLLAEIERVRSERDALDEQRQALQAALVEITKRPAPTVVQQEVKFAEAWDVNMAELIAARTTERVLERIQQPVSTGADATPSSSLVLGIINDNGLDLTKEPGLSESASVEQAQQRLRALLLELHHRTRQEGVRMQEAIAATEEAVTRQHLVALSQSMSQQEAYMQRVLETKINEVREQTLKELADRDADFRRQLRQQWIKINQESLKLAEHSAKLKQLHHQISREDDLEQARKELARYFEREASAEAGELEANELKMRVLGRTLEGDASKSAQTQVIH